MELIFMKRYIVNDKEVEYLHIEEKPDGTIKVQYAEKFNLVTAHMGVIMEKLRDNGLNGVHVFKRLKYDIIDIWLKDINQIHGVLGALNVPHACYEVLYDDAIIVIDTPLYEHALEMENTISSSKKVGYAYES